jgi:hypothetical protein
MKSLLLILAFFLFFFFIPSRSVVSQDTINGWFFNHAYAGSVDTLNTFSYVGKSGQLFQSAGTTKRSGADYYMDIQWAKRFCSVDNARVAPDSLRVDLKFLNPHDFSEILFTFFVQTSTGWTKPAAKSMPFDTLWHTWSFPTSSIKDFIYISLIFIPCASESSYVVLKALAKNIVLIYKDSVVVLDPMIDTKTGVAEDEKLAIPFTSQLMQNYPNPFNPSTTIPYFLRNGGDVDLRIFDLLGREVSVLERGYKAAGTHESAFDGSSLPSGTYCAILRVDGRPAGVRKLLLVK